MNLQCAILLQTPDTSCNTLLERNPALLAKVRLQQLLGLSSRTHLAEVASLVSLLLRNQLVLWPELAHDVDEVRDVDSAGRSKDPLRLNGLCKQGNRMKTRDIANVNVGLFRRNR